MAREIKTKLALDGEQQFKQAIKECDAELRNMNSELKAVTSSYDYQTKSVDALQSANAVLAKEMELQQAKVDSLKGAMQDAAALYGEDSAQVLQYSTQLNNAQAALNTMDKQMRNNNAAIEEAAKGNEELSDAVEDTGDSLKEAGKEASNYGDILKANVTSEAIISGIKAVADELKKCCEWTINAAQEAAFYADDMATLSTQTGVSTDTLQEFRYMTNLIDVDIGVFTSSMAKNIKSMSNAAKGTKEYAEAYETLGISVMDSNGNLRDSEEVYWEIIDAMANVENSTERDAIAMQIFGRSAQELNPLIAQGSDGFKKYAEEAHNMGYVLESDAIDGLVETSDAFERLDKSTEIARRNFGAKVAPTLTDSLEKISLKIEEFSDKAADVAVDIIPPITSGLEWCIDNSDILIAGITGITTGLIGLKVAREVSSALVTYRVANEGATIAQWALNAAQDACPALLLVSAIAAVTTAVVYFAEQTADAEVRVNALTDEELELIENSKMLSETIQQNATDYDDAIKGIESEYDSIGDMIDRVYELADQENRSNTEKTEMLSLIAKLNEKLPELGLLFNSLTGEISREREETEAAAEAAERLAKGKEAYTHVSEAEKNRDEARQKLDESMKVYDEYMTHLQELNEQLEQGEIDWTTYIQPARGTKECIEQWSETIQQNAESLKQAEEDYKEYLKIIEESGGIFDSAGEFVGFYAEIVEESQARVVAANEDAKTAIQELTDAYSQAVTDRAKDIMDSTSLFEEFAKNTEISGTTLLENLKSQVDGINEWADNINNLASRGIGDNLLNELRDLGPEAAGEIYALTQLTDEQLSEYNKLYQEKAAAARKIAVEEHSGDYATLKLQIEEIRNGSLEEAQAAIDELGGIFMDGKEIVGEQARELALKVLTELEPMADGSYEIGNGVVVQFGYGIQAAINSGTLEAPRTELAESIRETIGQQLYDDFLGSGKNCAEGFAKGISDGSKTVNFAMRDFAKAANDTFAEEEEIHSPSKVYQKFGQYLAQGLKIGFVDEMDGAAEEIVASVPSSFNAVLNATSDDVMVSHRFDDDSSSSSAINAISEQLSTLSALVMRLANAKTKQDIILKLSSGTEIARWQVDNIKEYETQVGRKVL